MASASSDVDDVSMPNPVPDPSQLPGFILNCRVELDTENVLSPYELYSVECFRREQGTTSLQVRITFPFSLLTLCLLPFLAMIFLKDNTLLRRELSQDDIKPRLLGHWGTCPGLVLIYAHLSHVIRKTGQDMLFFFFFEIDYCAPRGTEPHVALREWIHALCVVNMNMRINYAEISPMASLANLL